MSDTSVPPLGEESLESEFLRSEAVFTIYFFVLVVP
jgi:hypothetical protein